jgi:hypothetical protein
MTKIIFIAYLVVLLCVILFCFGCATIQSIPVETAPRSSFKSLPRTIVIAPVDFEKGLRKDTRKFYFGLVGEDGLEKSREILCQIFRENFEPEFQILKDPPADGEYLLVKMELGRFGISPIGLVGTVGQYSKGMLARLSVLKMPGSEAILTHKSFTVGHWVTGNRTLFYDAIKSSGEKVAHLLKKNLS